MAVCRPSSLLREEFLDQCMKRREIGLSHVTFDDAALPVEPGKGRLSVSVNGQVYLTP